MKELEIKKEIMGIIKLIKKGVDPNLIIEEIEKSILKNTDYALWGDGKYRLDTVCSICGSPYEGICGHQDNPNRKKILAKNYKY